MKQLGTIRITPYTVYSVRWGTYFLVIRVEHQKLNQTTAELSFGWVFGVQLGLRQTQSLIKTKTIRRRNVPPVILLFSCRLLLRGNIAGGTFLLLIVLVLISACVCRRPSWTPETQPNGAVHGFLRQVEYLLTGESSWTPKTQPGSSRAFPWWSFWCSTRLSAGTVTVQDQSDR